MVKKIDKSTLSEQSLEIVHNYEREINAECNLYFVSNDFLRLDDSVIASPEICNDNHFPKTYKTII